MARSEGQPTPRPTPSTPDRLPRLSRRSLLKGGAAVTGVVIVNELTGRPLLPSGAEAHEVIPRDPQLGSEPVAPARPTSPLDKIIQKGAEVAQSGIGAIRKELASLAGKPAAAHGLDEKNTKSNRAAVTERRVMELRPSSVINNVETFGHEQALTDTEMRQLIENLNARVGALSPEERAAMMRNDTYYGTMFMSESAYKQFFIDNNETFQTFLKRHEVEVRRMMKNANPSLIPPTTNETNDDIGFMIKRLVVVKDNVDPPKSHHLGYLSNGIKDSDGGWVIKSRYQPKLLTGQNGYYDPIRQIDYGLIHEWGHSIFHLTDLYGYDIDVAIIPQIILGDIPEDYRNFRMKRRNDLGNDFMAYPQSNFGETSSWQVYRRGMRLHDFAYTVVEIGGAPHEFPGGIRLEVNDTDNKRVDIDEIGVYKTRSTDQGKRLLETPIFSGKTSTLYPYNLFEKEITDPDEGTILLRIKGKDGKIYVRWLTAPDFNLSKWTAGGVGRGIAVMNMMARTVGDDQSKYRSDIVATHKRLEIPVATDYSSLN